MTPERKITARTIAFEYALIFGGSFSAAYIGARAPILSMIETARNAYTMRPDQVAQAMLGALGTSDLKIRDLAGWFDRLRGNGFSATFCNLTTSAMEGQTEALEDSYFYIDAEGHARWVSSEDIEDRSGHGGEVVMKFQDFGATPEGRMVGFAGTKVAALIRAVARPADS